MSRRDTILDVLRHAQSSHGSAGAESAPSEEVAKQGPREVPGLEPDPRAELPRKPGRSSARTPSSGTQAWLRAEFKLPRFLLYVAMGVVLLLSFGAYRIGYRKGALAAERPGPVGDQGLAGAGMAGQGLRRVDQDLSGSGAGSTSPTELVAEKRGASSEPRKELPVSQPQQPNGASTEAPLPYQGPELQKKDGKVRALRIFSIRIRNGDDPVAEARAHAMSKWIEGRLPGLESGRFRGLPVLAYVHEDKQGRPRSISISIPIPEGMSGAELRRSLNRLGNANEKSFRFDFRPGKDMHTAHETWLQPKG